MIMPEYLYRMKAHSLSRADSKYDMHMQAWLNERVGATKEQGKNTVPVFKTFEEFFDYEKEIESITGPVKKEVSSLHKRMAQAAAKLNGKT